jgi:hypothetical protein
MKMTDHESTISIDVLRELVHLDTASWKLFWKTRNIKFFMDTKQPAKHNCAIWNGKFSGKEAFCHSSGSGYLHGALLGKKLYAHRVIFALFSGHWPIFTIDHIDGNRINNDPKNLRDVNHQENMRNMKKSKANSSGHTGVSYDLKRSKYVSNVTVDGKTKLAGRFLTMQEAISARENFAKKYGFHENHGR